MKDFTLVVYKQLLEALQIQGYAFQTFSEFLEAPAPRSIMLRHDVDARKLHSLEFARIQHARGIVGTYYFRMVPQSFDPEVIRQIHAMGHEVGYHYEDMDFAGGDPHRAVELFERHLTRLRGIVPVSTICMHGSPRSRFDNKDVWKHYDYRDFGIVGEPYFELDFSKVFYLTDTGRRWDGHRVSVRDRAPNPFGLSFHSTVELIDCARRASLPDQIMMNFHPQRWTDDPWLWNVERLAQAAKNQVKFALIQWRSVRQSNRVRQA